MTKSCAFVAIPILNYREDGSLVAALQDAHRESPALAVYLLAKTLQDHGVSCDVIDWIARSHEPFIRVFSEISNYDIIFISSNSMNWSSAKILAEQVRNINPEIKICIGGPHPTHFPDSVILSGLFDALYRGEADRWISDIYSALSLDKKRRFPV